MIYKCIRCDGSLNLQMSCQICGKQYSADDKGVISMLPFLNLEKKKNSELYDALNRKKNKNEYSRFSTYLNYGLLKEKQRYEGKHNTSINLILSICKIVNFTGKKVIDIGCGRGGNLFYINSCFDTDILVGIDLSYQNILFCKSKEEKINFIQADAEKLPFGDMTFDVVLNIESALHYPNVERFYLEVERILEKNGVFIYVDIIEKNECQIRKKRLVDIGFDFMCECDYTDDVLRAIKANKENDIDDKMPLFDHSKMYWELYERKKKYILWIMKKK